jgi:hypothetical protein
MDFIVAYEHVIDWLVSHSGERDKFAHTYAGLTIMVAAATAFRRPIGSWLPFCTVVVAEIGNECIDRVAHGSWMWSDTIRDVAATLFWPGVLTLVLRLGIVPIPGRRTGRRRI